MNKTQFFHLYRNSPSGRVCLIFRLIHKRVPAGTDLDLLGLVRIDPFSHENICLCLKDEFREFAASEFVSLIHNMSAFSHPDWIRYCQVSMEIFKDQCKKILVDNKLASQVLF